MEWSRRQRGTVRAIGRKEPPSRITARSRSFSRRKPMAARSRSSRRTGDRSGIAAAQPIFLFRRLRGNTGAIPGIRAMVILEGAALRRQGLEHEPSCSSPSAIMQLESKNTFDTGNIVRLLTGFIPTGPCRSVQPNGEPDRNIRLAAKRNAVRCSAGTGGSSRASSDRCPLPRQDHPGF